jgi:hypothetical protein
MCCIAVSLICLRVQLLGFSMCLSCHVSERLRRMDIKLGYFQKDLFVDGNMISKRILEKLM